MALVQTLPAVSSDNLFSLDCTSSDASVAYTINGRSGHIGGRQYQLFDHLFEEHAREWDSIADGAAVELIRLSNLPEDVLAEIWEGALNASYISAPRTCETRQGYLSKDEFFILLAEVQHKLGSSDDAFSKIVSNPLTPRPRRNPFDRRSVATLPTPPPSPTRAPPIPPKALRYKSGVQSASKLHIDVHEVSLEAEHEAVADGYSEYLNSIGCSPLIQPSVKIRPCETPSPATPHFENIAVEILKSSDKEVVSEGWVPTLSKIEDVESEDDSEGSENLLRNTGSHQIEAIEKTYVELEVAPTRMRWNSDDFGDNEPASGFKSTRLILPDIPRPQQEHRPLFTDFSNQLAVQRLTSLVTSEPVASRTKLTPKSSIGNALSLVRKKTKHYKTKPQDPDKAESGYLYTQLAAALQDAVAEGNISLVASLFKLGADVNYSSVKDCTYHNILQVAVASEHLDIVEYFIAMGADGISVDNALVTAFFADNINLATTLVPHANVYHLRPFDSPGSSYRKLSASSLGRIIRDRTMPAGSRLEVLQSIMSQEYFDANKVVFQAYDTSNERLFEYSSLATLVSQLDVEAVSLILPSLGFVKRHSVRKTSNGQVHQMGPVCCIRPSHWRLSSDRALTMLEMLVEYSADVCDIAYWPGTGAMSPLGCAVIGESVDGVSVLLALDADPECLVYQLQPSGKETEAYSALAWAALKGNLDICTLLVDHGATPWRISFSEHTPLYFACKSGSIDVVEYLLSLDVERSNVDACLLAAVQGDEPRIVEVLLTVGACITPETWIAVMTQPRKPRERANLLSIIDLLLTQDSIILEEPVLAAIDSGNFAGLSRVLERRNGELDFDKNAIFGNWRWASGRGRYDGRDRTCFYYADSVGRRDFVALLGSYGWRCDIQGSNGRPVAYQGPHR